MIAPLLLGLTVLAFMVVILIGTDWLDHTLASRRNAVRSSDGPPSSPASRGIRTDRPVRAEHFISPSAEGRQPCTSEEEPSY